MCVFKIFKMEKMPGHFGDLCFFDGTMVCVGRDHMDFGISNDDGNLGDPPKMASLTWKMCVFELSTVFGRRACWNDGLKEAFTLK